MKMLILALSSLVAVSSFAAQSEPCNGNLEAQFIAQYDKVDYSYPEAGNVEHMSFGLKNFRVFNPNMNCPLSLSEAQAAVIVLPQINSYIQNGKEVSGVLVYNPQFNTYFID